MQQGKLYYRFRKMMIPISRYAEHRICSLVSAKLEKLESPITEIILLISE